MKFHIGNKKETFEEIIEKARHRTMTDEEREEQKVSWVYGQLCLSGRNVTKEQIRERIRKKLS